MTIFSAPSRIVAFMFCCVTTTPVVGELIPRTPPPKPATITKPGYESQLTVKFRDDLKARAVTEGLTSGVGADLSNVESVKVQLGLTFHPAIAVPQQMLDRIETQAAQRSRVGQPHPTAMMGVYGGCRDRPDPRLTRFSVYGHHRVGFARGSIGAMSGSVSDYLSYGVWS